MPTLPDQYSSFGSKIRALLGLSQEARVLLVGPHFTAMRADFAATFRSVHLANSVQEVESANENRLFELACVDLFSSGQLNVPVDHLDKVADLISPGGFVWLADTRVPSLTRLTIGRRFANQLGARPSSNCVIDFLSSAGFTSVTQLTPWPDHVQAKDFWTPEAAAQYLVRSGDIWTRLASAVRRNRRIQHHSVYVACRGSRGSAVPILDEIDKQGITDLTGPVQLSSISMRSRGALILACHGSNASMIARIALSPDVQARVRRNADCTQFLHRLESLPASIRDKIPSPYGHFVVGDAQVFVEQKLEGTEVWRISKGSRQAERAVREALEFIELFSEKSSEPQLVDQTTFKGLFDVATEILPERLVRAGAGTVHLDRLVHSLARHLLGRFSRIGVAHGDYHLGNVLADPRSGELLGVVDWDTYIPIEISGVDRAHFLIAEGAWRHNVSVTTAAKGLAETCGDRDRLSLAIAMLRIVERSSHFPSEFSESIRESEAQLRLAADLLA